MKFILFIALIILFYSCDNEKYKTIKINLTNISSDSTYFNDIDRVIITNNINTLNGKSTSIIENSFKRNLMYSAIKSIENNVFIIDSVPAKYYAYLIVQKNVRSRVYYGYTEELNLNELKSDTFVCTVNMDRID
ncbi:MAG: hypothetical protein IPN93_05320 [Bacteroidetes bacterium]|nr:hypothetical protein [Bacteroidota bacterium]MBK8672411.1 hypothetical protein [Bacteroidota bacterium]